MWQTLTRLLRHHWLDARHARRAVPPDLVERLRARVASSEQEHTGQIRICVEGSLPPSYLWRHLREHQPMPRIVRERALMMFAKLRVWDTEHNNGVLIYLLLAEHAIELVADRALARTVDPAAWHAMTAHLGETLQGGRFDDGLLQALDEVSALLRAHFPASAQTPRTNELPDAPVLR